MRRRQSRPRECLSLCFPERIFSVYLPLFLYLWFTCFITTGMPTCIFIAWDDKAKCHYQHCTAPLTPPPSSRWGPAGRLMCTISSLFLRQAPCMYTCMKTTHQYKPIWLHYIYAYVCTCTYNVFCIFMELGSYHKCSANCCFHLECVQRSHQWQNRQVFHT